MEKISPSKTITLHKARLRKIDYLKIPDKERHLFVILGVMNSEFHTFNKILIFVLNQKVSTEISRKARAVQFFQIAPILIGKINEGWNVITKHYFGTKLSKSIHPHLDMGAKNALDEIKIYFGKSNLVNSIRNHYSFHYPLDINESLKKVSGKEDWNLYFSEMNVNSLFHGCNIITMFGMLQSIDPTSIEKASHKLIDDIKFLLNNFDEFASGYMDYIAKKYLNKSIKKLEIRRIEVSDVPSIRDVALPFFVRK